MIKCEGDSSGTLYRLLLTKHHKSKLIFDVHFFSESIVISNKNLNKSKKKIIKKTEWQYDDVAYFICKTW